ncbi:MAG: hypothetical protein HQL82_07135 [Magnetococcales bacterium]|nr:hypothetical protein [Magnetococcales bacterium]
MENGNQDNKLRLINRVRKEALVRTAENLIYAPDWRTAGRALRRIMNQLKGIPSAGEAEDGRLWARFQSAYQIYLDRRSQGKPSNRGLRDRGAKLLDQIQQREKQADDLREAIRLAQSRVVCFQEKSRDIAPGPHQQAIRDFIDDTIRRITADTRIKQLELRELDRLIAELGDQHQEG